MHLSLRAPGSRKVCFVVVAALFAALTPAAMRADSVTYDLTLTPNSGSLYGGTGTFTIDAAPSATGVSTYTQASGTIDSLVFNIDGQTFDLAQATGTLIQFVNGQLTDITFSEEVGTSPDRFALHTTSYYAFYYNDELSASYGTFTATASQTSSTPAVPEPASLVLLGTGLLGGAGSLYRRIGARRS